MLIHSRWRILGAIVGSLVLTTGAVAQQFVLEIPGDPGSRSTAALNARELVIADARGQRFEYHRRPELDSEDGRYRAFYSEEARRYLRWPADGDGPMYLGTQVAGTVAWRRSQMQVRTVGRPPGIGVRPGLPGQADLFPPRRNLGLHAEVAVVQGAGDVVWAAQIDEDGKLDMYESRDGQWRHREFAVREQFVPGVPLALVYDSVNDAPVVYGVEQRGRIVEISTGQTRIVTRADVRFPRTAHLAAASLRHRSLLAAVDEVGRVWQIDPENSELEEIESRPGLFEPGIPITITAQRGDAELFLIDRRGNLVGFAFDRGRWSRPFFLAMGLVSGGHVAAVFPRRQPDTDSVHLASIDTQGRLHVWHDAEGVLVDHVLPDARFAPGAAVAIGEWDEDLAVLAVPVDGRWSAWRQVNQRWQRSMIADGFATGTSVWMLPNDMQAFAVDRTGRLVATRWARNQWVCSLCSPGLPRAPQLVRRTIVANEPLPPVEVSFDNRHSEELVLRLHDVETGQPPVEIRIPAGESVSQRLQRTAGGVLEEIYLVPGPDGDLVEEVHRVPLPPRGRYTASVYANRVTSLYFDRTRNKGPVPDEANTSLVSVGVFVLPPGTLLEDGAHIDIHREALARRNPGAAALVDPVPEK